MELHSLGWDYALDLFNKPESARTEKDKANLQRLAEMVVAHTLRVNETAFQAKQQQSSAADLLKRFQEIAAATPRQYQRRAMRQATALKPQGYELDQDGILLDHEGDILSTAYLQDEETQAPSQLELNLFDQS
jgi:hypothetical protein